jgi:hypothetical protein
LPGGLDNEFSAARATVTATYVLKSASDRRNGQVGTRFADAQLDLPSQNFAQERAKLEAEDPRCAPGGSTCPRRCCRSSGPIDLQPV